MSTSPRVLTCRVVLDDLKAIVVTAPYYEGEAPTA
jgi:hypothetical protein